MATSINSISFKQDFDLEIGELEGETFRMLIGVRVPTGDPEPTAPEFDGCTLRGTTLDDTAPQGIHDYYKHKYSYNSAWEPTLVRVLDAELGDYEVPENEATFEVKTRHDTVTGYTTVVYFTLPVVDPTP